MSVVDSDRDERRESRDDDLYGASALLGEPPAPYEYMESDLAASRHWVRGAA